MGLDEITEMTGKVIIARTVQAVTIMDMIFLSLLNIMYLLVLCLDTLFKAIFNFGAFIVNEEVLSQSLCRYYTPICFGFQERL